MSMLIRFLSAAAFTLGLAGAASAQGAPPIAADGVVTAKSSYPIDETIDRLKQDVAAKGILFFQEIDQSKLAANAGVRLPRSTLLVFGNPPLGTLFLTSNPLSGLDRPVRLLCSKTRKGRCGPRTQTSRGSRAATASRIGIRSSRWRAP